MSYYFNSYHEGFKKWVEIGNSGMFRPEMLQPMGLPEDVQVIAWGLSLERLEKNQNTLIITENKMNSLVKFKFLL